MTGRRLYDYFTDAAVKHPAYNVHTTNIANSSVPAIAWSFLSSRDKSVWNEMARRATPKKRAVTS